MRVTNVPFINGRYWAAIVAASMCGTNAGDLAAGPLGLGHVRGIFPIAAAFVMILLAEKALKWSTVAFYWLAIVVLRTMATNIADAGTHEFGLTYPAFLLLLAAFMICMLGVDRLLRFRPDAEPQKTEIPVVPDTNWRYWVLMLSAGVLGTALGDWIADDGLELSIAQASLLGAIAFACVLLAAYRFGLSKPWYWLVVVICRTWGTDLGDGLVRALRIVTSKPEALWISTCLTAALLAIIVFGKVSSGKDLEVAQPN